MRITLFSIFICYATLCAGQLALDDFDFSSPTLVAELDDELAEISGLSFTGDGTEELLAVQDELGKVYRLNANSGTLLWSTDFWKDGDYEGVEVVGEDIWIVKNTGTLYQIKNGGQPDQSVNKFNTPLTGGNDVEGLAYDAAANHLLLACKDDIRGDGNDKHGRYIYAFDLEAKTLGEQPLYAINKERILDFLDKNPAIDDHDKLVDFFARGDYDLSPSALAVHPATGHLYVASSKGNMLVIMEKNGGILRLHRFDKDYLPQAEGLAFGPDGLLYISTEARGKRGGRIYKFGTR